MWGKAGLRLFEGDSTIIHRCDLRYTYPYGVAVGFILSMLCERLPNTRKAQ